LSSWSRKNKLNSCNFIFRVDFSCVDDHKDTFSGEVDCVESMFSKSTVVKEKEFNAVSLTAKSVTDAFVRTGLSETGYSYIKNTLFMNKSGLPGYSTVKREIESRKEEIFKKSKVILNDEKNPVGIMTPIEKLLEKDYSNPNILLDLCVRSHLGGKFFKGEEQKYQKYVAKKKKQNNKYFDEKGLLLTKIWKNQGKYRVDPTFKSNNNKMSDDGDSEVIFSCQEELEEQRRIDEKRIQKLHFERYQLKGNFETWRNVTMKHKIKELETEIKELQEPRGGKKRKKPTKALKEKLEDLEEQKKFWETEDKNPSLWKEFVLSEKCNLVKTKKKDGTVALHLRVLVRRGDDGHPIFKGGFTLHNFNENISSYMFPLASYPNRIENHQIVSQVLGPENKELFREVLQCLSLDTNNLNGVKMNKVFRLRLDSLLEDGNGSTFRDFLVKESICKEFELKGLNEFIDVEVTNTFIYSADWKGLLLCYKSLQFFYSPFNCRTLKERKEEDLKNLNSIPLVPMIFDNPREMIKVLLRSKGNLVYMKTIPTEGRIADNSLHGEKSAFQSALFQLLELSGMKNVGLKSHTLGIYESYGIVSTGISVSKKNPLTISHAKIGRFRKIYEPMKKDLINLYRKYEVKYVNALGKEQTRLETSKFRSNTSRNSCEEKIKKLEQKISLCKHLIAHQTDYMGDLFDLLDLLDQGNNIEKEDGYLRHSEKWMRKEFINFETIRDTVIPILSRVQQSLVNLTKETGVSGYYFNHLVREYPLYITKYFHTRTNQRTMERIGYILNRLYRNSSGFGGRERKNKRDMVVARNANDEEKDRRVLVNRKIDTIVSCRARFEIRRESKTKDWYT